MRKCWQPAFCPFPTLFSTLSGTEITILTTFDLPPADAFSLIETKVLLFGKVLLEKITMFICRLKKVLKL